LHPAERPDVSINPGLLERLADYKSAIQQNTILRYAFGLNFIVDDAIETLDLIQ